MVTYDELTLLDSARANKSLKVTIVSNPLVRDALRLIRDAKTDMPTFRTAVYSLTPHLIYAATSNLNEKKVATITPLASINTYTLLDKIVLIPVLRSGPPKPFFLTPPPSLQGWRETRRLPFPIGTTTSKI